GLPHRNNPCCVVAQRMRDDHHPLSQTALYLQIVSTREKAINLRLRTRRSQVRVLQGAPTVRKDKAPSSSPLSAVAPVARRVIRSSEWPSDDALDIGPELGRH